MQHARAAKIIVAMIVTSMSGTVLPAAEPASPTDRAFPRR
jgi:hypothetical protein